ncbi:MAG TPA: efflux RND transporter periplasmic adaptor subunit [Parachlamydiaceae bacterium]|nr:efflux RND transporter periplasmic adaptor subunit [Parachlamydiaceae bacterium]
MHTLKKVLVFLFLLIAAFIGFYFWNLSSDEQEMISDHHHEDHEEIVMLDDETIKANGIEIEEAFPQNLEVKITSLGKIVPNEEKTVYIAPRFAGVAKAVYKKLGDSIKEGDVLAFIESNESLKEYEIKAPISGTIIAKNINLGMYLSGQENIFILSDLSTVWADFNIYAKDLSLIKVGDAIDIKSLNGSFGEKTALFYISPVADQSTQSVVARALVKNADAFFKPQLYVLGEIDAKKIPVRVAVKKEALQKMSGQDVVFLYKEGLFSAAPVAVGSQDGTWVEIISGLEAGERYVSKNSFLLKADIEKSSAEHDH